MNYVEAKNQIQILNVRYKQAKLETYKLIRNLADKAYSQVASKVVFKIPNICH